VTVRHRTDAAQRCAETAIPRGEFHDESPHASRDARPNSANRQPPLRSPIMTHKSWVLLLAVAAGAAAAMLSLGRHQRRAAAHLEHKADIKAWENEGGGIVPPSSRPAAASTAPPL
jgi:hypothetical protein